MYSVEIWDMGIQVFPNNGLISLIQGSHGRGLAVTIPVKHGELSVALILRSSLYQPVIPLAPTHDTNPEDGMVYHRIQPALALLQISITRTTPRSRTSSSPLGSRESKIFFNGSPVALS